MSNRCIYIIALVLMLFFQNTHSQILGVRNQYLLHEQLLNPAFTGSDKCTNYKGFYQLLRAGQYPGYNTQTLLTESQHKGSRHNTHGLGLHINRLAGTTLSYYGFDGAYAFSTMLNWDRSLRLSVGVQATLNNIRFNQFESSVGETLNRSYSGINVTPGIRLYSDKFFLNLAYNNVLEEGSFSRDIHPGGFHMHTGLYVGQTTSYLHYRPSVAVFVNPDSRVEAHVNTTFLYKKKWWSAFSLKALQSVDDELQPGFAGFIGYTIDHFQVAYGVQVMLPDFPSDNFGTHNFMISYRICPKRCGCAEEE